MICCYCKLDNDNVVIDCIVLEEYDEEKGITMLLEITGHNHWLLQKKDGRKNLGAMGWKYDSDKNAYIEPQPYPSWYLNNDCIWTSPTPRPNLTEAETLAGCDGFDWNEEDQNWMLLD